MAKLKVIFYNSTLFYSVFDGNKNQIYKLSKDRCEIVKKNALNDILNFGDRIVSHLFKSDQKLEQFYKIMIQPNYLKI